VQPLLTSSPPANRARQRWEPRPETEKADRLEIEATNISRATVNFERARLSCDAELEVETDGPLTIRLAGCGRSESFG
jgi:hypothetical protein